TLTKYLRYGEFVSDTIPTIGQNIDSLEHEGWKITTIDVAGQQDFRFLWDAHYPGTNAVIFVIDAADIETLPEARDIFKQHVFNNPKLQEVPVLILANKQDLQGAVEAPLLIQLLGLHLDMHDRTFAVFDSSILHGRGVVEAFGWIVNQLEVNE
ncbi:MAG: GTP-binding protein, partial [Candidatus Heimdallarchaeota archaeon]|nr:GTP-binding protein [Candidatus Heimdallarchaeota archaeon]MCK5145095.1 GTP-binding protein [Candidatus Heimdallarchaeota archaeon]